MMYGGVPPKILTESAVEVEVEFDPESKKVREWKQQQLERAGIEEFTAFRLALDPDVDWHKVVAAKEAGVGDMALVDLFL